MKLYHNYSARDDKFNIITSLHSNNFSTRRFYSTTPLNSLPIPILTINNLDNKQHVLNKRNLLINKAGIYSFINKNNNKQYIGSAKDLYLRLNEHLSALLPQAS